MAPGTSANGPIVEGHSGAAADHLAQHSSGFVNWRRRRVCLKCFPFAEGESAASTRAQACDLTLGSASPSHRKATSSPAATSLRA